MDIVHDTNWIHLVKIAEQLDDNLPSYVKQYTPLTIKKASNLNDKLFADDTRRLFPIDTPANTWTSAAYFIYNKEELPYKKAEADFVFDKIKKAAQIYGIAKDVFPLETKLKPFTKVAEVIEEPVTYALDVVSDNEVIQEFPMANAEGVKLAADHFTTYRGKYPAPWRKSIAKNILRKAASYGIQEEELPNAIRTEAGHGIPNKVALMDDILWRSKQAKHPENAIGLLNVNNMIAGLPMEKIAQQLDNIVSVMADFDTSEGLDTKYGKLVQPPADVVFSVSIKCAEDIVNDAVTLHQFTFSSSKLAEALTPSLLDNLLGDGFSSKIVDGPKLIPAKLANALTELDVSDKMALEEYMQHNFV